MRLSTRQRKALTEINFDLFADRPSVPLPQVELPAHSTELPTEGELAELFDCFNREYFEGRLQRPKIIYSSRMTSAGSYHPVEGVIKIGRRYHEIFPEDLHDTLKHEMIHLIHFRHDAAFKAEAARIGATVHCRSHPSLKRPPKYVYECPACGSEFPRQKRIVLASCGNCSKNGRYDKRFKLHLKWSRKRGELA